MTFEVVEFAWEAGEEAMQNDYDGKVDIAAWRDSNSDWYIRNSSTGQLRQAHQCNPGLIFPCWLFIAVKFITGNCERLRIRQL